MVKRFVGGAVATFFAIYAVGSVADSDEHRGHSGPAVAVVNQSLYSQECGSCHFAYQPGLLPAAAWKKLMSTLAEHFDENAELEAVDQKAITDYLVANAADMAKNRLSVKLWRSLKGKAPLRITEIPYIAHEHEEVSPKWVKENPEVKSFSYCDKCHTQASQGSYAEHEIVIPGRGRWED